MHRETSSRAISTTGSDDARLIAAFSAPAGKETILAHLVRLAAIKPVEGTDKKSDPLGDPNASFKIYDYLSRLLELKVTEVDLFIALDYFIEEDTSDFFPSYAKLKKRLK